MSFLDISKQLSIKWSALDKETKQKYVDKANLDSERYKHDFQEYQQTDDYKEFVTQQEPNKKDLGSPQKENRYKVSHSYLGPASPYLPYFLI